MNKSKIALITLIFLCFFYQNYAQTKMPSSKSQKLRLVLEVDTLTQQLYGLVFFRYASHLLPDSLCFQSKDYTVEQVSLGQIPLSKFHAVNDSSYFWIVLDSLVQKQESDSINLQVRYRLAWPQGKLSSYHQSISKLFPSPSGTFSHFEWEMYLTLPRKLISKTAGELIYKRMNADGTRTDYWQSKQADTQNDIGFTLKRRH